MSESSPEKKREKTDMHPGCLLIIIGGCLLTASMIYMALNPVDAGKKPAPAPSAAQKEKSPIRQFIDFINEANRKNKK